MFLSFSYSNAQKSPGFLGKWKAGYIINSNGDTIRGEVKPRGYLANQDKVVFISEGMKTEYSPEDIKGYGFMDFFYESLKDSDGNSKFYYRLTDGVIKHYEYYFASSDLNNTGSMDIKLVCQSVLIKNNGPLYFLKWKKFKRDMSNFIGDHPNLMDKIEANKYKARDLNEIIKEYNYWYKNVKDK